MPVLQSPTPMEMDNPDMIWDPSSSSEEDWGDDAWEVEGIMEEHINTRGDLKYKIAWGGWQREDGTNSTWEKHNGTTMQDVPVVLRRWQKNQVAECGEKAGSPLANPFHPFDLPVEESIDEGEKKKKKKKRPPMHYAFTEQANQARQMAVDVKHDATFKQSSSLASAAARLQDLRAKRDSSLRSLEVPLAEAISQCLLGLGPAPQKEGRYRMQKKVSLHHQMESLHVSKHAYKESSDVTTSVKSFAPVGPSQQTTGRTSDHQTATVHSFDFVLNRQAQPGSNLSQVLSRAARPLPQRPSAQPRPVAGSLPAARPPKPLVSMQPATGISSPITKNRTAGTVPPSESQRRRKIPSSSSLATRAGSSGQHRIALSLPNHVSSRVFLQAKWSATIMAANAAPVTFVNDLNEEAIPTLNIQSFRYLESEYIFGPGVKRLDESFMQSCDCTAVCTASLCTCQDDSEIQDDDNHDGSKAFAYDSKGLFTFNETIRSYVIECNKNCLCDARCRSRVAQRPRRFPIEVFKTEHCGWGVRSTVALPRGTVLGVYTGELIARETARSFSVKRASYLFDLDFIKSGLDSSYSVDAYNCGNWTRFVNHSCNPVCVLYSVVWDSVPALHQPKLAFVTNADIPARKELTIDYCPQARKGKGRAKSKMPGTPDCMCNSEDCRGFIYLR